MKRHDNAPMHRFGVVENIEDPLKLGRCKVRITGIHTDSLSELPTDDLPWALVLGGTSSANVSGIGETTRILKGSWVVVSFMDDHYQKPLIWGTIPGIPGSEVNQSPVDVNAIAEMVANTPPAAAPAPINNVEQPYIGSLTETNVNKLAALILKTSTTSVKDVVITTIKSNYTSLSNAGVLTVDSVQEKTAGLLYAAQFGGLEDTIKYVKNDVVPDTINSYYNLGYSSITGNNTNESPTIENLEAPALDKNSAKTYLDARKYDVGVSKSTNKQGFKDPTGKYPLKSHLNESDLNRLARGSSISKTIVGDKEAKLIASVAIANSGKTWKQSPVPYNAVYPNNKVIATEAGHVFELDDTPGAERINLHHRAGSFFEIDSEGNKVERTSGIRTIIVDKDELVYIKGAGHITIDGDHSILVKKALNIEVVGDANIKVGGNCVQEVTGSFDLSAAKITMSADNISLSATNLTLASTGMFTVGGSGIMTGAFGNLGAPIQIISAPSTKAATVASYSPTITIPAPVSRQEAADMVLEDSSDITSVVYANAPPAKEVESNKKAANIVIPVAGTCDFADINAATIITTNYVLSDLYGAHPFPFKDGQHGLTGAEIACHLKHLALNVLEPLRAKYASLGFKLNSVFREAGSNISKSKNISQHELGHAADISFRKIRGLPNDREQFYKLANEIKDLVPFDQLLLEYRSTGSVWIHISFTPGVLRRQILTMYNDKVFSEGLSLITTTL